MTVKTIPSLPSSAPVAARQLLRKSVCRRSAPVRSAENGSPSVGYTGVKLNPAKHHVCYLSSGGNLPSSRARWSTLARKSSGNHFEPS